MLQVEIELSLAPGLPQFHFIGLPDTALRESALRIRSAIREQGFELPKAQQVLVHVKPTHLKKTSRGLDLAIAAALLWETEQLSRPDGIPTVYGELTLKGETVIPDDMDEIEVSDNTTVITGGGSQLLRFRSLRLRELKDLSGNGEFNEPSLPAEIIRPSSKITHLSRASADVAMISAAGEHSVFFAGPPGSGKTTVAEVISTLVDEPSFDDFEMMRKIWKRAGRSLTWRPVLKPHHSITPLAMIGGGANLWSGEITRANTGVLIMDELLEFDPEIQESLREPVETGSISLVRAGNSKTYPASLQLLATANLCPCGKFVPRTKTRCICTRAKRSKILNRISGPFVDRFSILSFTDEWESGEFTAIDDCLKKVNRAIEFRKNIRMQDVPNAKADVLLLNAGLTDFQKKHLRQAASRRRQVACLQVARTLADLRLDAVISDRDLAVASEFTIGNHERLDQFRD